MRKLELEFGRKNVHLNGVDVATSVTSLILSPIHTFEHVQKRQST